MADALRMAAIGLGRIGRIHAQHVHEFASAKPGMCELTALVDNDRERAEALAAEFSADGGADIRIFGTVEELIAAGCSDVSFVCTPTETHRDTAGALVRAGQRVLLEKPLTDSLRQDREFVAWLNANHPQSIMLAFQRRFDAPLQYAKQLLEAGTIGRVFKIVSALEDSGPPHAEYRSGGLLVDMSVHNVDEILWMTGKRPIAAGSMGSLVYSQAFSPVKEDFDDGYIRLWFDDRMIAQIEVSRNHVSGYRVETWIFGEKGHIHVGRFEQKPLEVVVETYGRDQPIDRKTFTMRDYGRPVPEFVDRFGPAYRAELAHFIEQCRRGEPFSVNHNDGLRTMEVIDAALRSRWEPVPVHPSR